MQHTVSLISNVRYIVILTLIVIDRHTNKSAQSAIVTVG